MNNPRRLIFIGIAVLTLIVIALVVARLLQPSVSARHTADLPDDLTGKQIHLMYVLPRDGEDRRLDTNGVISGTVAAWQHWLAGQTDGRALRVDTYQGELDITFHRLDRTQDDLRGYGDFMRDEIEADLVQAGFDAPDKILAVYYDGIHDLRCGDGAWPPVKMGAVAALYLHGLPEFVVPCAANPFASSVDQAGYLEFVMLHEILHTIGLTANCAPNHHSAGHVGDSANDLMYAGEANWYPSALDVGNDDYYRHDQPGCLDLDDSGWLMP